MTDRSGSASARPSAVTRSSSALSPAVHSAESSVMRPRNRRLISTLEDDADNSDTLGQRGRDSRDSAVTSKKNNNSIPSSTPSRGYGLLSSLTPSSSRSVSPLPSTGSHQGPNRAASAANLTNFFNDSITQSWASVQGFASSIISGDDGWSGQGRSQSSSRAGGWGRGVSSNSNNRKKDVEAWGPAPPSLGPALGDVASGSRVEREEALKAAKRARVLESRDETNGRMDSTGNHKRRNSDDPVPELPQQQVEEYHVYIHKVQPNDTYAGLILRYRCREDAFRKANGLWSRDSVQMRKWLTFPVDACEIRSRPCEPPAWHNQHDVDHLAPTPAAEDDPRNPPAVGDDFFSQPGNSTPTPGKAAEQEETPWTHVRWVKIDSFPQPVEIARVARNAMGYFPPRRKKSIRTISPLSTPRQSIDLSSNPPGSIGGLSSRRQSSLGHRPRLSGTWNNSPGRGSDITDGLPTWMRRPGGVGSMGRNVRAPGPDKDYLNTWAKRHIPGLNLDDMPSMSVMGSETARFGFKPGESAGLVESHAGEGQDTITTGQHGTGLDRAAAAVETWLRGALTRGPGTPSLSGHRGQGLEIPGDLIELTDTGSDDGRPAPGMPMSLAEALPMGAGGTSGRSDGDGFVRGRSGAKRGKDD